MSIHFTQTSLRLLISLVWLIMLVNMTANELLIAQADVWVRWDMRSLTLLMVFAMIAILHAPFSSQLWQKMSKFDKGIWFLSMAVLPLITFSTGGAILFAMIALFAASCFHRDLQPVRWFMALLFAGWLAIMLMLLFFRPYGMARMANAWQEFNLSTLLANDGLIIAISIFAALIFAFAFRVWESLQSSITLFVLVYIAQHAFFNTQFTVGVPVLLSLALASLVLFYVKQRQNRVVAHA